MKLRWTGWKASRRLGFHLPKKKERDQMSVLAVPPSFFLNLPSVVEEGGQEVTATREVTVPRSAYTPWQRAPQLDPSFSCSDASRTMK